MLKTQPSKARGADARAKSLSPEVRQEIGRKGALARWNKAIPMQKYQGVLTIGDRNITCVVTDTEARVLSVHAVFETFGRVRRGNRTQKSREVIRPPFMDALNLEPFFSPELEELSKPYVYKDFNGKQQIGYKAEILPQLCLAYLKAEAAGKITKAQIKLAETSHLLIGALSTVGIIALVDEATGYQDARAQDALTKILEGFISQELRPWVKTFPLEFYKQLFRLKGLKFDGSVRSCPPYFGTLTNNIVYSRLAPGVLEELRKISPRRENGKLKSSFHQKLTSEIGLAKLREHLSSVVTLMKISPTYDHFKGLLDQVHPRYDLNDPNQMKLFAS